jgi:helicase SWR1
MEFKKFLPGFKVLSYHGNTKRRKELRQGWSNKHHFNVCITSYTLASKDALIFRRKPWYYMILDEAHMIKNFKSQRWSTLLMFRSFRRLLLTGTPLQNNLTELWALLQFLMSGTNFANLKEFGDWFANPLEKAIELGQALDDETQQRVSKLHAVLRPYLLRRLKRDVEKELPRKYEHLVFCPLSKRQRFLYDEFMSRRETRTDLNSGVYLKVANILMQLRKVCNHPDLFEVRPIVTSFAMSRSILADFETKELLLRRRMLQEDDILDLDLLGLRFINSQNISQITAVQTRRLDATPHLIFRCASLGQPPPCDHRTMAGFRKWRNYQQQAACTARWQHMAYLNRLRCSLVPVYSSELIAEVRNLYVPLLPLSNLGARAYPDAVRAVHAIVKSVPERSEEMASIISRFAFATPAVVVLALPNIVLSGHSDSIQQVTWMHRAFDAPLHQAAVKLQIAFPDPSLLQYDCGKLQRLHELLKERKAGGHRVLIFTQMTRILDILETFLNLHGHLYLRLDGATKIEDRQYITERFNSDPRIFCFISSSRSGGVGIKSVLFPKWPSGDADLRFVA